MRVQRAKIQDLDSIINLNFQFEKTFCEQGLEIPFENYYTDPDWIGHEIREGNQYVLCEDSFVFGAMGFHLDSWYIPSDEEGFYELVELEKSEAYIETLAIKKDFQRGGLGRRLVNYAKRKAQAEGKSLLSVDSFCLYDVKDFYLSCGFELDPELRDYGEYQYYSFSMEL